MQKLVVIVITYNMGRFYTTSYLRHYVTGVKLPMSINMHLLLDAFALLL